VVKLQEIDEVGYERRFVRRLLEHSVRVWVFPVRVIAFDRQVEVKTIID
jgi:hypothetical protein